MSKMSSDCTFCGDPSVADLFPFCPACRRPLQRPVPRAEGIEPPLPRPLPPPRPPVPDGPSPEVGRSGDAGAAKTNHDRRRSARSGRFPALGVGVAVAAVGLVALWLLTPLVSRFLAPGGRIEVTSRPGEWTTVRLGETFGRGRRFSVATAGLIRIRTSSGRPVVAGGLSPVSIGELADGLIEVEAIGRDTPVVFSTD